MPNESGIYSITNILNGKRYIGSTNNFDNRWRQHRDNLRGNRHINPPLQASWNKCGENSFKFEIIEQVPEGDLMAYEQNHLNIATRIARDKFFNINYRALKPPSRKGTKMSEEARRKISMALINHKVSQGTKDKIRKGMIGKITNPGRPRSQATRDKISRGLMGNKNGVKKLVNN